MKWKLSPECEDKTVGLVRQIADVLEEDVRHMSDVTGQKRAQCLASILRPMINMQLPNTGPAALVDRRQKPWRVQCWFGFVNKTYDLDDEGEFEGEVVRGFDAVIEVVRDCFDDYHGPTGDVWSSAPEFNDKSMRQRFGGLYSNISKGGGEASTRITYETANNRHMFLDVTVERADEEPEQKDLDLEEINPDSPRPGVDRLRAMREARGQS